MATTARARPDATEFAPFYASYVAGIFRSVRFGVAEAHGRGQMMEFNYLTEKGVDVEFASGCRDIADDEIITADRLRRDAEGCAWRGGLLFDIGRTLA